MRTSSQPSSSRLFWSAALLAAGVVLFGSVELGKSLGASLVARGASQQAAVKVTVAAKLVSEVLGGQIHAAAALGQASPIWTQTLQAASPMPTASPSPSPTSSASPSPSSSPTSTPTGDPFTPMPTHVP